MSDIDTDAVLECRDLRKYYRPSGRKWRGEAGVVRAVDGVSLSVRRGETLGIVGESGCGKSSLANAVLMLDPPTSGEVLFRGQDLTKVSDRELRKVRRRLQVVFQDPYASLNARMTVEQIVAEPLVVHGEVRSRAERAIRVGEALERVGLSSRDAARHPFEFSGGQRQRIGIARALISSPEVVICDEPVSALDVSVQAQVLNLLQDLQAERNLSYLFISHDLSVVSQLVDRVAVMYLGRIVEVGSVAEIFREPKHPYTRALLGAVPSRRRGGGSRMVLAGDVPNPAAPPSGCTFHPRCPLSDGVLCAEAVPELRLLGERQEAACHHPLLDAAAPAGVRPH
ncbi:ABC transporter ATP-binding protein [Kribbella qitaiheensis]|uniref:ABC transporter ATP-binding protein n=1 Tax=Kribbella qitaiheensis TaxID=1544730 RepID=UPI0036130E74